MACSVRRVAPIFRISAAVLSTLLFPLVFLFARFNRKLRVDLRERLGGGGWRTLEPRASVWIHAASVGELQGVKTFLAELQGATPLRVIVTTTSLTGRLRARELSGVNSAYLLPFDHPFFLKRVFQRVQPKVFLNFETELWPNLFAELSESGVPIVLLNGRISDHSLPAYRRLAFLLRPFLSVVAKAFVQSERDAARFQELGVPPSSLRVVGSTKFDAPPKLPEENRLGIELGIPSGSPLLVAGSVRPGESSVLLHAYRELRAKFPELRLLIAPRHPERFDDEAKAVEVQSWKLSRRTAPVQNADVFLLDSLGELPLAYSLATVCFVGGTLVDIGGHNPMEPAALGKPVFFGPHTENVEDAAQDLVESGAATVVNDSHDIFMLVSTFLDDALALQRAGDAAKEVFARHAGASRRIVAELKEYLQ